MSRSIQRVFLLVSLASALALLVSQPASAHEGREVGEYHFVVGWADEPAYSGFKNGVSLAVTDHDEKPVNGLTDSLKVEVTFGSETTTLELGQLFGQPGQYRGWMVPTRSGEYVFRFTGTIKGDEIDERFTCGEETFDCIIDAAEIQFPAKDPSTAQLAERLDRESSRLAAATSELGDDTDVVRVLAIVGILLAILALVLHVLGKKGRAEA